MNVLFVNPHPDDIEFACFGTLLKHKAKGDSIYHLTVSNCSDLKRNSSLPEEVCRARKVSAPQYAVSLDLPNTRVYEPDNRERLRKHLEKLRDGNEIGMVYSPWLDDINQDHSATAEEVVRVFRYCTVLQYEITHSCPGFKPDYYEEISEAQKDSKMRVVRIFKSQSKKDYASPEYIESVMMFRGLESGFRYAEAFKAWRIRRNADE